VWVTSAARNRLMVDMGGRPPGAILRKAKAEVAVPAVKTALDPRVASFREAHRNLEASVLPLASSLDGRRFSFQASRDGLQSVTFHQGEGLIAGRISPQPALLRFGPRISEEGGADVPAAWAAAR
jgi:hypothetical protein